MVCWSRACGLRVENLESCTSGMPVSGGKQSAGRGKMRRKAALKKNPAVGQRFKIRSGVQRVATHAAFIHAERFAHHQHHIGLG